LYIDTGAMVIEVSGLAEGKIGKELVIVHGHGIDVGYPEGQEVDEDERPEALWSNSPTM